jgi:hypothetical protein
MLNVELYSYKRHIIHTIYYYTLTSKQPSNISLFLLFAHTEPSAELNRIK